jgi:diguanylate cyclase (GGDEF)-like protein/PAS domain S-box-containing protein
MCTAEGKGTHYSIDLAGVWVDCVGQRRPVIHNDYAHLAHRKGLPEGHAPVLRELVVPVMRNEQVVAILGVGNKPEAYDGADVMIVNLLADLAWDITGKKRAEFELNASEKKFHGIFSQSPIAIEIYDAAGRLIDANLACMELFGVTELEHLLGFKLWNDPNVPLDARQRLARNETVVFEGVFDFSLVKQLKLYPTTRSGICYIDCIIHPLRDAEQITGYLVQINDITERMRAEDELRRTHASLELTNLELQQALAREKILAHTDSLTGIFNRRYFFELAAHEFEVAKRYGSSLALIMFDIDHFKAVNDHFGHQAGDEILRQVAQIVRQQLRVVDLLARYGGEEFTVLLPSSSAEEAAVVAERFRAEIAAFQMTTERGAVSVTVSIGITENTASLSSLDQLISQADQAMYAAKQTGRDRIVIAG